MNLALRAPIWIFAGRTSDNINRVARSSTDTPLNTFANRANLDQAALLYELSDQGLLFAYINMISSDSTLVDLTSNVTT